MSYPELAFDKAKAINRYLLSPALLVILSIFSITACSGSILLRAERNVESKLKPAVRILAKAEPESFQSPYTLVVFLDSKSCGGNLIETVWWSDWQRHMNHKGMGFLFVTSKRDSADVAIAARMDDVDAPVLVLPESGAYISDLWAPAQSIPLKLLLDARSEVKGFWLVSVLNEETSNTFLTQIDSLIVGD